MAVQKKDSGNPKGPSEARLIGEFEPDYHLLKVRWYTNFKYGEFQAGDKIYAVSPPDQRTSVPPAGFEDALAGLVGRIYHRMDDNGGALTAGDCFAQARRLFTDFFIEQSARCEWRENGDDGWRSSCGKEFYFEDGTPSDNGMVYCMKCGKPAVEIGGADIPEEDGHDGAM